MTSTTVSIVTAVLVSNGLFAFVQYLITRHDTKKNIKGRLAVLEKDVLRTQLLMLILLRDEEKQEILTIAEHYFTEPPEGLGGNWYMTSIFNKWLASKQIGKPDWFDRT